MGSRHCILDAAQIAFHVLLVLTELRRESKTKGHRLLPLFFAHDCVPLPAVQCAGKGRKTKEGRPNSLPPDNPLSLPIELYNVGADTCLAPHDAINLPNDMVSAIRLLGASFTGIQTLFTKWDFAIEFLADVDFLCHDQAPPV